MTALSGFIPFQIGALKSAIEVVRRIPGLSDSIPTRRSKQNGAKKLSGCSILFQVLACKLELAATVSQERRRDVAHLNILLPCVRAFLGKLLQQVELGHGRKDFLKVANQVLKLTTKHRARNIGTKHQINWKEILPRTAIARTQHEKIRCFKEQQLEQSYSKSKGVSRLTSHLRFHRRLWLSSRDFESAQPNRRLVTFSQNEICYGFLERKAGRWTHRLIKDNDASHAMSRAASVHNLDRVRRHIRTSSGESSLPLPLL